MDINKFKGYTISKELYEFKGKTYAGWRYKYYTKGQYVLVDIINEVLEHKKTYYWSIGLTIGDFEDDYHCKKYHEQKLITGRIGVTGLLFAKAVIQHFEKQLSYLYPNHKNIIYCQWTDNRRRKAYAYALKKMGYKYGIRKFGLCLWKEVK